MEWVWFPDGYWAEREVVDAESLLRPSHGRPCRWAHRATKSHSEGEEVLNVSPRSVLSDYSPAKTSMPQSPCLTEEAHVHSLQNPSPMRFRLGRTSSDISSTSRSSRRTRPTSEGAGEVAYASLAPRKILSAASKGIKAAIHTTRDAKDPHRQEKHGRSNQGTRVSTHSSDVSQTSMTLDGVRSYFTLVPGGLGPSSSRHKRTALDSSRGGCKVFGKAPWHQNDSLSSSNSATSSVREILIGQAPSPSPVTGSLSVGKYTRALLQLPSRG